MVKYTRKLKKYKGGMEAGGGTEAGQPTAKRLLIRALSTPTGPALLGKMVVVVPNVDVTMGGIHMAVSLAATAGAPGASRKVAGRMIHTEFRKNMNAGIASAKGNKDLEETAILDSLRRYKLITVGKALADLLPNMCIGFGSILTLKNEYERTRGSTSSAGGGGGRTSSTVINLAVSVSKYFNDGSNKNENLVTFEELRIGNTKITGTRILHLFNSQENLDGEAEAYVDMFVPQTARIFSTSNAYVVVNITSSVMQFSALAFKTMHSLILAQRDILLPTLHEQFRVAIEYNRISVLDYMTFLHDSGVKIVLLNTGEPHSRLVLQIRDINHSRTYQYEQHLQLLDTDPELNGVIAFVLKMFNPEILQQRGILLADLNEAIKAQLKVVFVTSGTEGVLFQAAIPLSLGVFVEHTSVSLWANMEQEEINSCCEKVIRNVGTHTLRCHDSTTPKEQARQLIELESGIHKPLPLNIQNVNSRLSANCLGEFCKFNTRRDGPSLHNQARSLGLRYNCTVCAYYNGPDGQTYFGVSYVRSGYEENIVGNIATLFPNYGLLPLYTNSICAIENKNSSSMAQVCANPERKKTQTSIIAIVTGDITHSLGNPGEDDKVLRIMLGPNTIVQPEDITPTQEAKWILDTIMYDVNASNAKKLYVYLSSNIPQLYSVITIARANDTITREQEDEFTFKSRLLSLFADPTGANGGSSIPAFVKEGIIRRLTHNLAINTALIQACESAQYRGFLQMIRNEVFGSSIFEAILEQVACGE
jgi:hypothetical protein